MSQIERKSAYQRSTKETQIEIALNLDGRGESTISTGIGFLDHMLTAFAAHAGFDLEITCRGDLNVDGHHTVEDLGICLGRVLRRCLGEGKGIRRYGNAFVPMDEALVHVALDFCGRGFLACDLPLPQPLVGEFEGCLAAEFLRALAYNAGITLHVRELAGSNSHHILEAAFKALARALKQAVIVGDPQAEAVSTKGSLDWSD